jgi:hypothetical protein
LPRLAAAAGVLAAAAAFTPSLRAQAATGALGVTVVDGASARVRGVSLATFGPDGPRAATTDGQGEATLLHLRPGRYRVHAEGRGVAADADVIVGAGGTTRVTLRMGTATGSEGRAGAPISGPGGRATRVEDDGLRNLPRPADAWSVVRDVPGVVLDRVDVGGSDSAQQSLVISRGDPGPGAVWRLDGVDVTDPAALGSTSIYPDLDSLSLVEVRTSALDVRVRTPGAQISLFTRDLGPRWSGRLHARATGPRSDNRPADLAGRSLVRNDTDRATEMGGEVGGPIGGERFWMWGACGRTALRQQAFTGHEDRLRTTDISLRGRARVGAGTLSVLGVRAEKIDEDRDVTLSASPEARWRQSGPARLLAAEDRRPLGPVSLLTRVSYLDAGFRLEPRGGTSESAFEDFRGVFQRSYQRFETRRPRFEAGVEAAVARRGLGFAHVLVGGAGYRRSVVTTEARWPGNEVLAFERQSVFFRAFGLTGFALPTRALRARSLQEGWEGYAQDEARRGRLGVTVGLRMDRLTGRSLASSVEANPAFPALLPTARYDGGPTEIRWFDLLPRAGLSFDLARDGGLVARLSYAAYAAPLGAADVAFDNPLGREGASLTYYWIDANGNHTVDPGELDPVRGLLAASGVDPASPALAVSPHAIASDLRAPRTHEVTAGLERGRGRTLRGTLQLTYRRLVDPLWRPLRGLTRSDYAIRGRVRGTVFGEPYDVGYYAPASLSRLVPGNGRLLANREGYRQDVWGLDATLSGRLGARLDWQVSAALSDWRELFTDPARSLQDPTSTEGEPLLDGGAVAVRGSGLGRGDIFASARWTAAAGVRASLPWHFVAATRIYARDGFPIPYFQVADTGDPTNAAKNVLVAPQVDAFRLPPLVLADARVERALRAGPGTLTAAIDVFNLLDRATTLQVTRDVELPSFARPLDLLHPRIVRFGLEYRF